MTKLERDQQLIAKILERLLVSGLGSTRFDSDKDGAALLPDIDAKTAELAFEDVLGWLIAEGLIRVKNKFETMSHGATYIGVQLTSAGLRALNEKPADGSKSVAEELSNGKGELSPSAYVRMGALFGGFVGGAVKSLS